MTRWNGFADQNVRSVRMLDKLLGVHSKTKSKVLHPKGVVIAKGAPQYLTQSHGHSKSISRRQSMLNKTFMMTLSDVLATEAIGNEIIKSGVRITQVRFEWTLVRGSNEI